MRFYYFLMIAAFLLLSACISPKYNYTPSTVSISDPALNSVNVSKVGETILKQGEYKRHDSIYLKKETKIILGGVQTYTLFPGYYLKHGEDKLGEYYKPGSGEDSGRVIQVGFADPWKTVFAEKDTLVLCVVSALNVSACGNITEFDRKKKKVFTKSSFLQRIVYNGMIGSKINIGYRKSSGRQMEPVLSKNKVYDLSNSKTIFYAGVQIEVIEATKQHIKYKVIQSFNNPSS